MTSIAAIMLPAVLFGFQEPPAAGTVSGFVDYSGTAPKVKMIPIPEKYQAMVGAEKIPNESAVIGAEGALKNVFVRVKSGLKKDAEIHEPKEASLKIQKGRFDPRVVGIQVGAKLVILNRNEPGHTFCTHGRAKLNREFNVTLAEGASWSVTLDQAETMIQVRDDVHPWMVAWIGVVEHPFFAVTDEKGRFEIQKLPPGEYVLEAWHELFGTRTEKVTIQKEKGASVSLSFRVP